MSDVCAVCGLTERGFGFQPRVIDREGEDAAFCSIGCLYAYSLAWGYSDVARRLTQMEIKAFEMLLPRLGEKVAQQEQGRPLSQWSRNEILDLSRFVVENFRDCMGILGERGEIPVDLHPPNETKKQQAEYADRTRGTDLDDEIPF